MQVIKEIKGNYYLTLFSNNNQIIAAVMSSILDIIDYKSFEIVKRIKVKNIGKCAFSPDDHYLVIKTTTSVLYIYDVINKIIIFHKKIGLDDGYNILFINNNEFITGDWEGHHIIFNIATLRYEAKKLPFQCQSLWLTKEKQYMGHFSSMEGGLILKSDSVLFEKYDIILKDHVIMKVAYIDENIYYLGDSEHGIRRYNIKNQTYESEVSYPSYIQASQINDQYIFVCDLFKGYLYDKELNLLETYNAQTMNSSLSLSFANHCNRALLNIDRKLKLIEI